MAGPTSLPPTGITPEGGCQGLGISDEAADGLAAESGDPRFAWDCYRRFVQMYGEVVEGVPGQVFEDELQRSRSAEESHRTPT